MFCIRRIFYLVSFLFFFFLKHDYLETILLDIRDKQFSPITLLSRDEYEYLGACRPVFNFSLEINAASSKRSKNDHERRKEWNEIFRKIDCGRRGNSRTRSYDGKAEIRRKAFDHSAWSHCFSDDTLIILLYTLYRIYVSWCDGTDYNIQMYKTVSTLSSWGHVMSMDRYWFLVIFIYIYIYYTIYYDDLFRCFWCLVGGCSVSMWWIIISIIWWYPGTMSVVRYSCCCYRLMWRQPSVCSSTSCLAPCRGSCSGKILF